MKSIAYPYVYDVIDGVYLMRDGVGDKLRRIPRKSEVVAFEMEAADVLERVREMSLGRHFIGHLHGLDFDFASLRAAYKSMGYRTLQSEEFFVHDTEEIPEANCVPPVRRVTTPAESDAIRAERRNKKAIRDCDLDSASPEHRLYAVIDGPNAYGWVGSVPFGDNSWIADLYVLRKHRGKGFGRALMCEVTRDDRAHGVRNSVLLASNAGARLYPHIGYRQIGMLQLFCPVREK